MTSMCYEFDPNMIFACGIISMVVMIKRMGQVSVVDTLEWHLLEFFKLNWLSDQAYLELRATKLTIYLNSFCSL